MPLPHRCTPQALSPCLLSTPPPPQSFKFVVESWGCTLTQAQQIELMEGLQPATQFKASSSLAAGPAGCRRCCWLPPPLPQWLLPWHSCCIALTFLLHNSEMHLFELDWAAPLAAAAAGPHRPEGASQPLLADRGQELRAGPSPAARKVGGVGQAGRQAPGARAWTAAGWLMAAGLLGITCCCPCIQCRSADVVCCCLPLVLASSAPPYVPSPPPARSRYYFGREVGAGDRSPLNRYDLPRRRYLGPTSMDTEMAFLMANVAQAGLVGWRMGDESWEGESHCAKQCFK